MKKLRLDLEMLVVEKFEVVTDGQALGTVQGHQPTFDGSCGCGGSEEEVCSGYQYSCNPTYCPGTECPIYCPWESFDVPCNSIDSPC